MSPNRRGPFFFVNASYFLGLDDNYGAPSNDYNTADSFSGMTEPCRDFIWITLISLRCQIFILNVKIIFIYFFT